MNNPVDGTNSDIRRDMGMDLTQLKETATELKGPTEDEDLTPLAGGDWMSGIVESDEQKMEKPVLPQLPEDGVRLSDTVKSEVYDGPGMVINPEDINPQPHKPMSTPGLPADALSNIENYMSDMDEEISEVKAIVEEKQAQSAEEETDDEDEAMSQDEFDRSYKEAVVIIDKTGMGSVVNFTDEEREKLEKVKTIRLEEVETISLKSIKSKKIKKKDSIDALIKRQTSLHSTHIVALASGYTATIRGCSTYELIALMRDSQNPLLDMETKWSLIHSKIESTSIGKMTYNEFLHNTSALDYNIFLFGLLCATYPDADKIPLKCEKCPTEFNHHYTIKSLIRAEKMTDAMQARIVATIDASHSEVVAKDYHLAAPVNITKTIKLPVGGIIVEVYVQSAYDFINKSIKELSENKETRYNQASVLSSFVNRMYIPDPDNIEEYFEIDSALEITKVIYSLGDTDIIVLTKQGDLILDGLNFEFGLMNVQCPNCKHQTQSLPMDLETILFYKYQQAMSTKIE